jgi:hypothetical protein
VREQLLVSDAQFDTYSVDQLRELLGVGKRMERARAMGALARRAGREEPLLAEVVEKLEDPAMRDERVMGTISLAHIGVACLLLAASDLARSRVKTLIDAWPEPDRGDLLWFLRSEEIAWP